MKHIKSYKVFEDHAQLNIPFREKAYKGKSVHEDLVDALTDLQTMKPDKYFSNGNPRVEIDKVTDEAFKMILDSDDEFLLSTYVFSFVNNHDPKDEKYLFNKETIKQLKKDVGLDDIQDFSSEAAKLADVRTLFSKKGLVEFLDDSRVIFDEDISDMLNTVEDSFDKDEDGLIDIWRTVKYNKGDKKDLYERITKGFKGVGVYWTWEEGAAEAHWGESGGHSITLHAKVSVENVDWLTTVYDSAYGLKEEKEIRIKNNGNVMIIGFHDDEINKYIELENGPLVVKAGSVGIDTE
jgi:hypothetical protein